MNYLLITEQGKSFEEIAKHFSEIKNFKILKLSQGEIPLISEIKKARALFLDSSYGPELASYIIHIMKIHSVNSSLILLGRGEQNHDENFHKLFQDEEKLIYWDLDAPASYIKGLLENCLDREHEERMMHVEERLKKSLDEMEAFQMKLSKEENLVKSSYRNLFPRRSAFWGGLELASYFEASEIFGGEFNDAIFFKERLSGVLWHVPSFSLSDLLLERWIRFKDKELFDISLAKMWLKEFKDSSKDVKLPLEKSWVHWLFYQFDKSTLTLEGYSGGEHIVKVISSDKVETLTCKDPLPLLHMNDVSEAYFSKSLQTGNRIVILSSGLVMNCHELSPDDWDTLLLEISSLEINDFIDEIFIRIENDYDKERHKRKHDSTLIVMDVKESL